MAASSSAQRDAVVVDCGAPADARWSAWLAAALQEHRLPRGIAEGKHRRHIERLAPPSDPDRSRADGSVGVRRSSGGPPSDASVSSFMRGLRVGWCPAEGASEPGRCQLLPAADLAVNRRRGERAERDRAGRREYGCRATTQPANYHNGAPSC